MRARPKDSVWRYVVLAVIIGIAVGLFLSTILVDEKPRTLTSAPANTINPEQQRQLALLKACQIYERAKTDEAETLVKNFVRHGLAHKRMGKMPLGDRMDPKPGTVRWEWKITLAQLWEHEPMWKKTLANYNEAGCAK